METSALGLPITPLTTMRLLSLDMLALQSLLCCLRHSYSANNLTVTIKSTRTTPFEVL